MKLLFRTYGWPNDFDAGGFETAYVRLREFFTIRRDTVEAAQYVLHAITEMRKAEENLLRHSRRLYDGVWDHDRNKDQTEIARLETETIQKSRDLENARASLQSVKIGHGGWDSEEEEVRKTWRKYLENQLKGNQDDLTYMTGAGSEHYNQDQVSAQEVKVAMAKKRLENVHEEPTSVEMAIMPLKK